MCVYHRIGNKDTRSNSSSLNECLDSFFVGRKIGSLLRTLCCTWACCVPQPQVWFSVGIPFQWHPCLFVLFSVYLPNKKYSDTEVSCTGHWKAPKHQMIPLWNRRTRIQQHSHLPQHFEMATTKTHLFCVSSEPQKETSTWNQITSFWNLVVWSSWEISFPHLETGNSIT